MRQLEIYDFEEFREKFGIAKKLKGFNEGLAEAEAELNNDVAISVTIKEEPLVPELEPVIEPDQTPGSSKRARKPSKRLADFIHPQSARKRKATQQTVVDTPKASRTVEERSSEQSIPVGGEEDLVSFSVEQVKNESESMQIDPPVSVVNAESAHDIVPNSPKTSNTEKESGKNLDPSEISPERDYVSVSNTLEQLKNEFESGDGDHPVMIVRNEPEQEIIPKNSKNRRSPKLSKKSDPLSDKFFARMTSPEVDSVKRVEPMYSSADPIILTEKRIRKKKTFSDDFISPDFIFGTPKQSKTPTTKPKKAPPIVQSAESLESEDPKRLIIDESTPRPSPSSAAFVAEQPPVARVAPLKIKLPLIGSKKGKIHIVQPKIEETFDRDSDDFGDEQNKKDTDFAHSQTDSGSETVSSPFNRSLKISSSPPPPPPSISTKPKKKYNPLKINLQLKSTKNKLKKKIMLPRSAPFKTSSKIKWREGETEEEYKRRRRIQNRMSKQNYKMRKLFVTAYSFWSAIEMEKLLKDQPDLMDFQAIRLVLQSKWRNLSSEEKEVKNEKVFVALNFFRCFQYFIHLCFQKYRLLAKKEKQKRFALFSSNQPNSEQNLSVEKPAEAVEEKTPPPKVKETPAKEKLASSKNYFEAADEFWSSPSTSKVFQPTPTNPPEISQLVKTKKKTTPSPKKLDRDTNAVITRRPMVGPVEARSRWWLFSNGSSAHRRKRGGKKENSPPRGLTAELLDNVAIFRLMSKSFEQMGNRLLKQVSFKRFLTQNLV